MRKQKRERKQKQKRKQKCESKNAEAKTRKKAKAKAKEAKERERDGVMANDLLVGQILEQGEHPFSLKLYPILQHEDNPKTLAFHAEMLLHSPTLGELAPNRYAYIAGRTDQCIELAKWAIESALKLLKNEEEFAGVNGRFLILDMPMRMLTRFDLASYLKEHLEGKDIAVRSGLCLAFPSDILHEEELEDIAGTLRHLRALGVRTALLGFGDKYCPMARLVELTFDFVSFDARLCRMFEDENTRRAAQTQMNFVRELGMEFITLPAKDADTRMQYRYINAFGYEKER